MKLHNRLHPIVNVSDLAFADCAFKRIPQETGSKKRVFSSYRVFLFLYFQGRFFTPGEPIEAAATAEGMVRMHMHGMKFLYH